MKIVIFAGGVGTRLWPLSRKSSPKQFEKIIGDKSTLQLAAERLQPDFNWQDIFISTGNQYLDLVKEQLPEIPEENLIGEPQMRDVGPAVGLVTAILEKKSPDEPMTILWSDHLVKKEELFRKTLKTAEKIIQVNPDKILFISQKPRFASQNLGWIEFTDKVEEKEDIEIFKLKSFLYRPDFTTAQKFFESGRHAWNLGYFVTTPKFLWSLYQTLAPELFNQLLKIQEAYGGEDFEKVLEKVYPNLEKISFDNAILEKMDPEKGLVISQDLAWSDVGAWEALKEALAKSPADNVIHGKVEVRDCEDSLIYNYTDQLLAAIDLKSQLVINAKDVVLVCRKDSVPKIKKLVEELEKTEFKNLI